MRSKASGKGKGMRVASSGNDVRGMSPLTRPAGAQKILFTPVVRSRVHEYTWVYFFITWSVIFDDVKAGGEVEEWDSSAMP